MGLSITSVVNPIIHYAQGLPASLARQEVNGEIQQTIGNEKPSSHGVGGFLRASSIFTVGEKLWNAARTGDWSEVKTGTFAADLAKGALEVGSLVALGTAIVTGAPLLAASAIAVAAVRSIAINSSITAAGEAVDHPEVITAAATTASKYASYAAGTVNTVIADAGTAIKTAAVNTAVNTVNNAATATIVRTPGLPFS